MNGNSLKKSFHIIISELMYHYYKYLKSLISTYIMFSNIMNYMTVIFDGAQYS